MILNIIFYIFAALAIAGALTLILSNNAVRAVVSMVFTFVSAAVIWFTMQQEYLALLLVVVYIGAVLVMFMFVVMMLDIEVAQTKSKYIGYWPLVIIVCIILGSLLSILIAQNFSNQHLYGNFGSVRSLGEAMFQNKYLYAFELMAMLLLSAMVASITLTLRSRKPNNKSVDPAQQVKVRANERLTMVKMDSEIQDFNLSNNGEDNA